ncbi:MAG: response regulator, partial [Pseudomonadota bacterium]|nr:response regulator [Pseudomonadota bacterium]
MRKKILIVDNCPVTLLLLTHMLQKEDYEVETAEDGLAAIEIMDQFKPNIMIIDLVMPKITGDKLCRVIRKKPEFDNVLLVILSAIAAEEKIDFISFGADACIAKGPSQEMIKNILTVFNHAESGNRAELSQQIFGLEHVHVRQVTKELLVSKKNFEITLQNTADGFVTLTSSAKIVSVNSVAIDFFKIPEEKLISTTFFDHFATKQKNIIIDHFNKITNSAIEIGEDRPIILHDKYLLIKMVPVFNEESKSIIVLIDDITKRKLAEQELDEHRIHLEELVAQRTAELEIVNENLQNEIGERQKIQDELQSALSKVKQLSGFLPICASCKKIRDDKGYWNQLESYIRDHSEAEFSHGICPDCAEKLYPELYDKNPDKKDR